jgi:hypothetical protein
MIIAKLNVQRALALFSFRGVEKDIQKTVNVNMTSPNYANSIIDVFHSRMPAVLQQAHPFQYFSPHCAPAGTPLSMLFAPLSSSRHTPFNAFRPTVLQPNIFFVSNVQIQENSGALFQ